MQRNTSTLFCNRKELTLTPIRLPLLEVFDADRYVKDITRQHNITFYLSLYGLDKGLEYACFFGAARLIGAALWDPRIIVCIKGPGGSINPWDAWMYEQWKL